MYYNENMALRIPPKRDPNQKDKTWWYCIDGDTSHTTNWTDWWLVFRLKKGFFRFGYGFTWLMIKARLGMSHNFFPAFFFFCLCLSGFVSIPPALL